MKNNSLYGIIIPLIAAAFFAGCGRETSLSELSESSSSRKIRTNVSSLPTAVLPNASASSSAGAGKLLINPKASDLYFLYFELSGLDPSISNLAMEDSSVKSADEFKRSSTIAKAEALLRAQAASVSGVRFLNLDLYNSFGPYDEKYGEYSFDLQNSSTIEMGNTFGRSVELALTNGGVAQAWKLPSSDAQDVLRRTGGNRRVVLALKLEILNSPPTESSSPIRINARITEYEIKSSGSGIRLGKVVVQ